MKLTVDAKDNQVEELVVRAAVADPPPRHLQAHTHTQTHQCLMHVAGAVSVAGQLCGGAEHQEGPHRTAGRQGHLSG